MSLNYPTDFDDITKDTITRWIEGSYDQATKESIKTMMQDNPQEVLDAFYTTLSFGTGGMRGIMGVGSNRMNQYTVRGASQGLANYLLKQEAPPQGHSVFIGYDSRRHSRYFAEEAAKVLAGNNIKVLLCKELRPVPMVSFGCRFNKCSAAIMITASHNPPEYNGFKVYWKDGAQVLPPHDQGIIAEVSKITDPTMVKMTATVDETLIQHVGDDLDDAYLEKIQPLQVNPSQNKEYGRSIKIVYSNLHGAGITVVPKALVSWGFANLYFVESQVQPDGNFPTVKTPNPENREAMSLGLERMLDLKADLLLATDPDTDRVGVGQIIEGQEVLFTGNQIAVLCLEHICQSLKRQKRMPENAACIKTIVTTELFQKICDAYKIPCFNVLTGFKYIAEKIREWETAPTQKYRFLFGAEESYGYLLGDLVRDKDAIISCALISDVALAGKLQGKSLMDLLYDIYEKYGVFVEKLASINFEETKQGKEQMARAMNLLAGNPPTKILSQEVLIIDDYKKSLKINLREGTREEITVPRSDVYAFWLSDGTKLMIRPSGTEPKIKIYCGVNIPSYSSVPEAIQIGEQKTDEFMQFMKEMLSNI